MNRVSIDVFSGPAMENGNDCLFRVGGTVRFDGDAHRFSASVVKVSDIPDHWMFHHLLVDGYENDDGEESMSDIPEDIQLSILDSIIDLAKQEYQKNFV